MNKINQTNYPQSSAGKTCSPLLCYRKATGFASRRDRTFLLRSEVLRLGYFDGLA